MGDISNLRKTFICNETNRFKFGTLLCPFFLVFFSQENSVSCSYALKKAEEALVCVLPQGYFKIPIMLPTHLDEWKESAKTSLNGPLAWLGNKLS